MRSGQDLALEALRVAHKKLQATAEKAKREADEYLECGTEMIAIHRELADIVSSKETGNHVVKQLEVLKKRRDKVDRIRKKDFIKLIDKQHNAEIERDNLGSEISMLEFRIGRRS